MTNDERKRGAVRHSSFVIRHSPEPFISPLTKQQFSGCSISPAPFLLAGGEGPHIVTAIPMTTQNRTLAGFQAPSCRGTTPVRLCVLSGVGRINQPHKS